MSRMTETTQLGFSLLRARVHVMLAESIGGASSVVDIARATGCTEARASEVLADLAHAGYVRRVPGPSGDKWIIAKATP